MTPTQSLTPQAIMALADDYAHCAANARVESLYGSSSSYTADCLRRENEARSKLSAALSAAPAGEPVAPIKQGLTPDTQPVAGEPVARIDPMQDPMRPGYFMNYAENEAPAEMVLRKLACWLGVGGYNAPTVDAEQFHRKIVDGVESLLRTAAPAAPKQAEAHGLLPERLMRFLLRDLKTERADLAGFLSLNNEVRRAAEYDEWIAAVESYCQQYAPAAPQD